MAGEGVVNGRGGRTYLIPKVRANHTYTDRRKQTQTISGQRMSKNNANKEPSRGKNKTVTLRLQQRYGAQAGSEGAGVMLVGSHPYCTHHHHQEMIRDRRQQRRKTSTTATITDSEKATRVNDTTQQKSSHETLRPRAPVPLNQYTRTTDNRKRRSCPSSTNSKTKKSRTEQCTNNTDGGRRTLSPRRANLHTGVRTYGEHDADAFTQTDDEEAANDKWESEQTKSPNAEKQLAR
jgi:hypothetical protein